MAWKWIFDARLGRSTPCIGLFGVPAQPWLFDPALSVFCVIVLCSWQALGYAVLIFLVGLKNVPTSLHEAASLDGASALQRFRYVTMPLLQPSCSLSPSSRWSPRSTSMHRSSCWPPTSQGAPGLLVRVLVLDMIENSFRNYRVGYAAAEAVILLSIVLVLTAIQFGCLQRTGRRA